MATQANSDSVQSSTTNESRFPGLPFGWYCVGFSEELKKGQILRRRLGESEVVLYRTEAGRAAVSDAYCPHLGAHFGHGGTVNGENLKCPFHSFEFNTDGDCVKTGYDTKPPPKCKLKVAEVREQNGIILAWWSPDGRAPEFEVPPADDSDWTPLTFGEEILCSHPQETSENSVDVGHFTIVHGYNSAKQVTRLVTEGPYLGVKYAFERPAGPFEPGDVIDGEFQIHIHGLGYSLVEVDVESYGIQVRNWVLPCPTENGKIVLRLATSMRRTSHLERIHPALRFIPKMPIQFILQRVVFRGFRHDVKQDFDIWEHKKYLDRPALAKGDGPIGPYRKWCKQFYV